MRRSDITIHLMYCLLQRFVECCQGNRSTDTKSVSCLLNDFELFDVIGGYYHRVVHVLELHLHTCTRYCFIITIKRMAGKFPPELRLYGV